MKLKIKQSYSVRGTFVIRNEQGELIAREVSPELAAWIVAAATTLDYEGRPVEFGPALTEDCEVEI